VTTGWAPRSAFAKRADRYDRLRGPIVRLEAARWRKSSYSANEGTDCVEVAFASEAVGVRDSKNTTPRLAFTRASWRAFLAGR
jgi:hypothetical protein